MKKAILLHNPVNVNSLEDELDVLDQAYFVENVLAGLGYATERMEFDINTQSLISKIAREKVSVVFNLVESINDSGRLSFVAPAVLELCKVPFTGSGAGAIFLTTDKVVCKTILAANQISTPAWVKDVSSVDPEKFYIIKPISEDGSVGIDDAALLKGAMINQIPPGYFAEEYIHGREFNISVIGDSKGCLVLPPAEMCFAEEYYETKPRILGYKAKWDVSSSEYQNTTRSFKFEKNDAALVTQLSEIAKKCWNVFGLSGYARVDIRVDADHLPKIIEINANPCIAPDSGFIAACYEAGLSNSEIIKRIIDDAKQY